MDPPVVRINVSARDADAVLIPVWVRPWVVLAPRGRRGEGGCLLEYLLPLAPVHVVNIIPPPRAVPVRPHPVSPSASIFCNGCPWINVRNTDTVVLPSSQLPLRLPYLFRVLCSYPQSILTSGFEMAASAIIRREVIRVFSVWVDAEFFTLFKGVIGEGVAGFVGGEGEGV